MENNINTPILLNNLVGNVHNSNSILRHSNKYNPYPQISPMSQNFMPINENINVDVGKSYKSANINNVFQPFSNTNSNNSNSNSNQNLPKLSTSYILSNLSTSQNISSPLQYNIPSSPTSNSLHSPLSPSSPSYNNSMALTGSNSHSFNFSSVPTTPTTVSTPPLANGDNEPNGDDYESLKDGWKKVKDISAELARLSKMACKHDLQAVDLVPNLLKEYENFGNVLKSINDKYNFMKSDDRQQKKRKESDKNAEKRKKRREATLLLNNVCKACKTTDTPEWRKGPDGTKSLCNACGLHFAKIIKKEASLTIPHINIVETKETMKVNSILN